MLDNMRRLRDSAKDRHVALMSFPPAASGSRHLEGTNSHEPFISSPLSPRMDYVEDGDAAQAEVPHVASGPTSSSQESTSPDADKTSVHSSNPAQAHEIDSATRETDGEALLHIASAALPDAGA